MSKNMNRTEDQMLEDLFDAARATPPEVPAALSDRVLGDAIAAQSGAGAASAYGWREWFSVLGGKRGVGGLITAACVGFWIGVAPPQALPDLAGLMLGQDIASLEEDATGLFGWDIEEG